MSVAVFLPSPPHSLCFRRFVCCRSPVLTDGKSVYNSDRMGSVECRRFLLTSPVRGQMLAALRFFGDFQQQWAPVRPPFLLPVSVLPSSVLVTIEWGRVPTSNCLKEIYWTLFANLFQFLKQKEA